MRIPRDGAFLIRQREGEPDSFAITFKSVTLSIWILLSCNNDLTTQVPFPTEAMVKWSTAGSRRRVRTTCWAPPPSLTAWWSLSTTSGRSLCTARSSYATRSPPSWWSASAWWVTAGTTFQPLKVVTGVNCVSQQQFFRDFATRTRNAGFCMKRHCSNPEIRYLSNVTILGEFYL